MKDDKSQKVTTESLVMLFRDHFEDETGTKIDFRRHQYLENSNGLSPIFSYSFAETVVDSLYRWANAFCTEHQESLDISGFEYNTMMSCDQLRSQSLKSLIEDVCGRIAAGWK